MNSQTANSETLHNEATVTPDNNDIRNEVVRQDQQTADQNNQDHQENGKPAGEKQKGTRNPYDGSKWHGVSSNVEKLENIGMATKALERLEKRFDYLLSVLRRKATIITDHTLSVAKRSEAFEEEAGIKKQIDAILKLKKEIEIEVPKLEEKVVGKVDAYDSSYLDGLTF